jgi:hypothetical protein
MSKAILRFAPLINNKDAAPAGFQAPQPASQTLLLTTENFV